MCNNSSEVLRRVAEGESMLIANNGMPAAILIPAGTDTLGRLGTSGLAKLLIAEAETRALGQVPCGRPGPHHFKRTQHRRSSPNCGAGGDAAAAGLLLRQLDLLTIDAASLWRAGRLPTRHIPAHVRCHPPRRRHGTKGERIPDL